MFLKVLLYRNWNSKLVEKLVWYIHIEDITCLSIDLGTNRFELCKSLYVQLN